MKDRAMKQEMMRRQFLKRSAAAGILGLSGFHRARANGANERIRVGVMGLSRGLAHIEGFQAVPNVEIAYVCDVDERRLAEGVKKAVRGQEREPKAVTDFRRILEDPEIDVLSIAAPNFWHAPAAILACSAGKHVYVEKPGSHTAEESEWLVQAARKHDRKVQMGNQRRSVPAVMEAIQRVKEGAIGELRFARCWYDNTRGSIGKGQEAAVPDWLQYDLWQGPAPKRPYRDNLVHYNWHWFWHYGNGELGNNGVHALDLARWGLEVDLPLRVTSIGGRYSFDDDQETPDTNTVAFDFGSIGCQWEGSSCHARKAENHAFVTFYGDGGSLAVNAGAGYQIFDIEGKEIEKVNQSFSDVPHFKNFADAIREGTSLNAEIEDAQKSALYCHLGNIAYRTQGAVEFDPETKRIVGNPEGESLWGRKYEDGWKPTI